MPRVGGGALKVKWTKAIDKVGGERKKDSLIGISLQIIKNSRDFRVEIKRISTEAAPSKRSSLFC